MGRLMAADCAALDFFTLAIKASNPATGDFLALESTQPIKANNAAPRPARPSTSGRFLVSTAIALLTAAATSGRT
jgi:hypothetical protein